LNWIAWCWAIGLPKVLRSWLVLSSSSAARLTAPSSLIAAVRRVISPCRLEARGALAASLAAGYPLEEAARRDHRKLGAELDLFSFPEEIGSGLPVFHPKGGIIKREMEDYVRRRHIEEGFQYVSTPHISKDGLFHTSGHLPYYAETMYPPMELEGAKYQLKAMSCPMHNLIYRSRGRSYRELPLRLFEFGTVYRYEKSGVVHGLTRARGFTQDDAHIFCTREQIEAELDGALEYLWFLYGLFDLVPRAELSTRPDNKLGSDEEWDFSEEQLESALKRHEIPYVLGAGEGLGLTVPSAVRVAAASTRP